jgi:hypothetical protein
LESEGRNASGAEAGKQVKIPGFQQLGVEFDHCAFSSNRRYQQIVNRVTR